MKNKDKIKYLIKHWSDKTTLELGKELDVKPGTIRSWAYQLRKRNIKLERKKGGYVSFIEEAIKELS